jgi:hypothetical protein
MDNRRYTRMTCMVCHAFLLVPRGMRGIPSGLNATSVMIRVHAGFVDWTLCTRPISQMICSGAHRASYCLYHGKTEWRA